MKITYLTALMLGFLAGSPLAAHASSPGDDWKLVYQDEFEHSGNTGFSEKWTVIAGDWKIDNGQLAGHGQLMLNLEIPEAQRLTFDVQSAKPADLTAMLGIDRSGYQSGYFLGFASNNNHGSKLLVGGKLITENERTAEADTIYHIDARRDGHQISLRVNDEIVLQYQHELPWLGANHAHVGFYFYGQAVIDNVRVYTKPDELSADARAIIDAQFDAQNAMANNAAQDGPTNSSQASDQLFADNRIDNGSFEQWRTGVLNMPAAWSVRLFDREDDAELLGDFNQAHTGRRVMRLASANGVGVTLDAVGENGVVLEPGQTYDITCWAKSIAGEPTITIEPGGYSESISGQWQAYRTQFTMPRDADGQLGMFVRLNHGEALIDDVSIVPVGKTPRVSDETQADRRDLDQLSRQTIWHTDKRDPDWTARVPIVVTELMDSQASKVVLRLKLCDVLADTWYDRIGGDALKIVDTTTGKRVPHAVIESDRFPGATAEDELVFAVNVPPRSSKTYYAYYTAEGDRDGNIKKELPLWLARPSRYAHELDIQIEPAQQPVSFNFVGSNGTITAYQSEPIVAVAISPTGEREESLTLSRLADQPVWALENIPDDEDGVWRIDVTMRDGQIFTGTRVSGQAMWASNNMATLSMDSDDPIHDAHWARIAAARGEREAFQVGLRSASTMAGVVLRADEFVHTDGQATIPSQRVNLEYVDSIHVTMPWPLGRAAGWYRDPLVPWRQRDLSPDQTEIAWVTVDVPRDAKPGEYWGNLVATDDAGHDIELPIRLTVFDFTMPERIDFAAVLGGDIWDKASLGYRMPDGPTNHYRSIQNGEAALALAQLLSEHHASPFYYHHDKSPYAVPWHYDPATGEATFDFTRLDKNIELMVEHWGIRELFFGGKFAAGWRRPGKVFDWSKDLNKAWTADWEQAYPDHTLSRATPEGQRMVKAYAAGIAKHLYERGWLEHAYLYITDEDKSDEVRDVAEQTIATVEQTDPRLNTLVISNAEHRYPAYLDSVDTFVGRISNEHLDRLRSSNKKWWGVYNSAGLPTTPLAFTRALGARFWHHGETGYVNWAIWRKPDMLVETNTYTHLPANAGYPANTFVTSARFDTTGLGTWVYPWPQWEPLDSSRAQTLFVSSIRMASFREAVEDYEYLRRATTLASRMQPDAQGTIPLEELLLQMRQLIDDSQTRILKFDYYNVNATTYTQLREKIGQLISESKTAGSQD